MKYLIIIIVFFSLNLNAKDNTLTKVDTAKVSWNRVYKDAKDGVKAIASGLKVGVEKVWIILTKQQIVKSIINTVIYIVMIIFLVIFFNMSKKRYKLAIIKLQDKSHSYRDSFDETAEGATCIIFGVMCGILLIFFSAFFIISIDTTITGLINPEYGAIKDVISFINGRK